MSTYTDERVLKLSFDNSKFEQNVKKSQQTLQDLNKSLDATKIGNGLKNIGASVKDMGLDTVTESVKKIGDQFSTLRVLALDSLLQIKRKIEETFKSTIKAFTTEPIFTGFAEYETQMGAVQTILANTSMKGSTLDEINRALDELNLYADKTIYNFTEMTKNIGTFTAAGVDLFDSVQAIKGIANMAALSGSTSAQASNAMYQLSQALAAGRVNLMDWNSVVNAGMGGKQLQKLLLTTADALGTIEKGEFDDLISGVASFRESLSTKEGSGWLTADVLTDALAVASGDLDDAQLLSMGFQEAQLEYLNQLADTALKAATEVKSFSQLMDTLKESAQSGWTQTWQILLGDFGEAKELFTAISDVVGGALDASSNKRNTFLSEGLSTYWKQFAALGVADPGTFLETLRAEAIKMQPEMVKIFKDADFDPLQGLVEGKYTKKTFLKAMDLYTDSLEKMTAAEMKRTGTSQKMIDDQIAFNKALQSGKIDIDEWMKKFQMKSGRQNIIEGAANIFKAFLPLAQQFSKAMETVFPPKTGAQLYELTVRFAKFSEKFKLSEGVIIGFKDTFSGILSVFKTFGNILKAGWSLFSNIMGMLSPFFQGLLNLAGSIGRMVFVVSEIIDKTNILGGVIKVISALIRPFVTGLASGFKLITDIINSVTRSFTKNMDLRGFENVSLMFDKIVKGIESFYKSIGGFFKNLIPKNVRLDWFEDFVDVLNKIKELGSAFTKIHIIPFLEAVGKSLKVLGEKTKIVREHVTKLFDKFKEKIVFPAVDKIKELFGTKSDFLVLEILGNILDRLTTRLEGVHKAGSTIKDVFVKTFNKVKQVLEDSGVLNFFRELWDTIKRLVGILVNDVRDAFDGIKKSLGSGDFNAILDSLNTLITGGVIWKVIDFFRGKKNDDSGGILGRIRTVLDSVKDSLQAYQDSLRAGTIRKIAEAIAILAASILVLSLIDSDKLTVSLGAIGGLMAGLSLLMLAMSQLEKAKAMNKKDTQNPADVLAGGIKGFLKSVSKTIDAFMSKMATIMAIVGIATAVLILAGALKKIASIPEEDLKRSGLVLGIMTTVVTAIYLLLDYISKKGKNRSKGLSSILSLVGVVLAIKLLIKPLKELGEIPLFTLEKGLNAITQLLVSLGAFSLLTSIGKNANKAVISMFAVAFSLNKLVPIVAELGKIPRARLENGVGAISVLLLAMGGMMALVGLASTGASSVVGMLAMSLAIVTLAGALTVLSEIPMEKMSVALKGLAGGMAIMAVGALAMTVLAPGLIALAAVFALFSAGVVVLGAGLALGASALGIFAAGLVTLGTVGRVAANGAVKALETFVLGIIGILPKIIDSLGAVIASVCDLIINSSSKIAEAVVTVISAVLKALLSRAAIIGGELITLIDEVLKVLAEKTGSIVDSLMVILISIIDGVAARTPELVTAVVNLVTTFFASVIDAVKATDTDALVKAIAGFGIVAALIAALNVLAPMIPTAMLGVLGVGAFIAEVGIVLAAIGKLSSIPGLKEAIGDGAGFLVLIGSTIGKFVGSLVGGFGEGVSAALPQIGADLSSFMKKGQVFFDGAGGIDAKLLASIGYLTKAIVLITASSLVNQIASFITGENSLSLFGDELKEFGPKFASFYDSIAHINPQIVTAAGLCASSIAELYGKLPKTGGWMQAILGDGTNSLATFAEQLIPFGKALVKYGEAVKDLNVDVVTKSVLAADAVVELNNKLPKTGGLLQDIMGEVDMESFGDKLVKFGKALVDYSIAVADLDTKAVLNSQSAANAVVALNDTLPKTGGLVQAFMGEADMETFGTRLVKFGESIVEYSDTVSNLKSDVIQKSVSAASAVIELQNSLGNSGGVISWFTGDNSLSKFGDTLVEFGKGMVNYGDTISGVDTLKMRTVASAGKFIIDQLGTASVMNDGKLIKDKLTNAGQGIAEFGKAVAKVTLASISDQVSIVVVAINRLNGISATGAAELKKVTDAFNKLGKSAISEFGKQLDQASKQASTKIQAMLRTMRNDIDSGKPGVRNSITMLISEITSSFKTKETTFKGLGRTVISKIKEGIDETRISLSSVSNGIANEITISMNKKNQAFTTIGKNIISNVSKGMTSDSYSISTTAYNVGSLIMSKLKSGVSSGSSTIANVVSNAVGKGPAAARSYYNSYYNAGSYVVTGFARGITYSSSVASSAAARVGQQALRSLNRVLDIHSPSRETGKAGGYFIDGFVGRIVERMGYVSKTTERLGEEALYGLESSMSGGNNILDGLTSDPVIRPVMDLTNVKSSIATIDAMMSRDHALSANAGVNSIVNSRLSEQAAMLSLANRATDQNGVNSTVNIAFPNLTIREEADMNKIVNKISDVISKGKRSYT